MTSLCLFNVEFVVSPKQIASTFQNATHILLCTIAAALSLSISKGKGNSPVTGLEWPRGFQQVKVPRFHDNGTGWW